MPAAYDPPAFSPALARLAEPFWRDCPPSSSPPRIPNDVHQPWLHGTTMKWEHVLGMIGVRFVLRPRKYALYFDKLPPPSPQWACACVLATDCIKRKPSVGVPGRPGRRIRMYHYPEMMRYDLLLENGGIFLDHDSYALKPIESLRSCCPPPLEPPGRQARAGCDGGATATVVAGFEQEAGASPHGMRKLNPGVLMAERGADFLKLWRASWTTEPHTVHRSHCIQCRVHH